MVKKDEGNDFYIIEPLTTPNKQITSTFDKSDTTFSLIKSIKSPEYNNLGSITLLVLPDQIVIPRNLNVNFEQLKKLIVALHAEESPDKKSTTSIEDTEGFMFSILGDRGKEENEIKIIYDREKDLKIENVCLFSKKVTEGLNEIIKDININQLLIQVIIYDWMTRNQIADIVNLFIKIIGFKGIMLLPSSFCYLISKNGFHTIKPSDIKTSAIVKFNDDIYTFIDEFTLIDTYIHKDSVYYKSKDEPIRLNLQDISEEFTKLKLYPNLSIDSFVCNMCNYYDYSEDKIDEHFKNSSKCTGKGFFIYKSDQRCHIKSNRLKLLNLLLKLEDDVELFLNLTLKDNWEDCLRGAHLFKDLEISKDIWMTDDEWKNGGIRMLKEKILFYL